MKETQLMLELSDEALSSIAEALSSLRKVSPLSCLPSACTLVKVLQALSHASLGPVQASSSCCRLCCTYSFSPLSSPLPPLFRFLSLFISPPCSHLLMVLSYLSRRWEFAGRPVGWSLEEDETHQVFHQSLHAWLLLTKLPASSNIV